MRLAATQTPPYPHYATLTVKKLLNGKAKADQCRAAFALNVFQPSSSALLR